MVIFQSVIEPSQRSSLKEEKLKELMMLSLERLPLNESKSIIDSGNKIKKKWKNAKVDSNFERKILKTNYKYFQLHLIKFYVFYIIENILLSIFENIVFFLCIFRQLLIKKYEKCCFCLTFESKDYFTNDV